MFCSLLTIAGFAFSCGRPSGPVRPALCCACLTQQSSQKRMPQYEQSHTGDFSSSQASHVRRRVSPVSGDMCDDSKDDSKVGFTASRKTLLEVAPRVRFKTLEDSDLANLATGISGAWEGDRAVRSGILL